MKILLSLLRIEAFALRKMCLFCVIEKEVGDFQAFGELARLFYSAVMFLVRLELVGLTKQAESLVEEPVAAGHIMMVHRIVRLVPDAGEFFTVIKLHGESELFCLGGGDIEKGRRAAEDLAGIPCFYDVKTNPAAHMLAHFLLDGHICDGLDFFGKLFVTVETEFSVVFPLIHALADDTDEPDDAQHMVYMFVGYKYIMDITDVDSGIFKHF